MEPPAKQPPPQQLFQGDAGGICDDFENAVGDILCDALDELESVLMREDSVLLDTDEIRKGVDKVMYKYQHDTVDQCMTFKKYATTQLFAVGPDVVQKLEAQKAAALVTSSGVFEEEVAVDEEIASLRELAQQTSAKLTQLKEEEAVVTRQLSEIDPMIKRIQQLSAASDGARAPMEVDIESLASTASAVKGLTTVTAQQLREWDTANEAALGGGPGRQTGGVDAAKAKFAGHKAAARTESVDEILRFKASVGAGGQ